MSDRLKEKFIAKLEEQYGTWEKMTSRFGNATFGEIAIDLCISASQFSKLISGSATEGMYIRSFRNIDRLIEAKRLAEQRDEYLEKLAKEQQQTLLLQSSKRGAWLRTILFSILALAMGALAVYFYNRNTVSQQQLEDRFSQHPLSPYFDQGFSADFDPPYLSEPEIQDYCPCSAYEGEWSLNEEYKMPLPGSRKPGVYYLAKKADVRMKCSKSDTLNAGKGRVLVAYEYLINEIWVDLKETPLSPKYFDKVNKVYTPEFETLTFEVAPDFQKVATIHSFFINKFEIYKDSIVRKGEPCGRFATDVDKDLATLYEIDLKYILNNVLGNLTKTDCEASPNLYCDPNDLTEKESVINFECLYTIKTENLGIGGGYPYRKGYRLEKQNYSNNLTCKCN